jgi:hypothetical protein
LVQGEELDNAIVDFHLELVDGVLLGQDALGELLVGLENSVDGLMNGTFREAAHPEQALFHFVQVFFEVTFHEPFPCAASAPKTKRDFSAPKSRGEEAVLASLETTEFILSQPKRPVM